MNAAERDRTARGAAVPGLAARALGRVETCDASLPLAEAASPPDRDRLADVVRDHIDFVWRVLRRQGLTPADADDGTQRVFLVFRDKARRVAPGTEKGFLFHTAVFVAKELRRGMRRVEEPTDGNLSPQPSPSHRVEAADFLDKAMADLDDAERAAFVLFEVEGLTMDEIAQMLDCPPGTVASRLRRARGKVKAAAVRLDSAHGGGS
jgi:RNA polymerase sigma-70 factor (ECF subfamily)